MLGKMLKSTDGRKRGGNRREEAVREGRKRIASILSLKAQILLHSCKEDYKCVK